MSDGATFVSLADVVTRLQPPLSDSERGAWVYLMASIAQASRFAQTMPTTLDAHARGLIVEKLKEAEHWSLELLRAAYSERNE